MKINLYTFNSSIRGFLLKTVLLFLPLIITLVLVNYFSDSANLFDNSYERKIAQIISEGYNVTNISNYDERLVQKELVRLKKTSPDIIVVGSSRTMLITSHHFNGYSLMNNSVSGASIEDIIAVYQLYADKSFYPKKIILGIDPWTFNENNDQMRWKSLTHEYNRFHGNDKQPNNSNNKYKELFSISYFQSSIKFLPKRLNGNSQPLATSKSLNVSNTKLADGSLVYSKLYRDATSEQVTSKANRFIQNDIYSLTKFNTISERIYSDFALLINSLKNNNIEIILFLTPYHPTVYELIKRKYPMVLKTEDLIIEFANENKLTLFGSFNPSKIGLDKEHFYDGMHCNENGIELILQSNSTIHQLH
jgi:hypothetical protein